MKCRMKPSAGLRAVLFPLLLAFVSGKPYTCRNTDELAFVVQMCAQHEIPALSSCLLTSPTHVMSKLCACANPEGLEGLSTPSRWFKCLTPCWPLLDKVCYWHASESPVFEALDHSKVCPNGTVHNAGPANDQEDVGSLCEFPEENVWAPPTPLPPLHKSGIASGDRGETALMRAAKFGLHTVVADMLQDPDVLRTIDGVNLLDIYSPRTSAPYAPTALHYA